MIRVVFNLKGGVGKTSITCNLAAAFAEKGKKTLVLDLDPQCNSTQYLLGPDESISQKSIADFFDSILRVKLFRYNLRDLVQPTSFEDLWVIPGSGLLADLQGKLESRYKIQKLAQALGHLVEQNHFDEVFIDTPPALNFYSMSAMIAAQRVLIPFDCDAFSMHGLSQVTEAVEEVSEDHNPDLEVEGVVINQYHSKARLHEDTVQSLRGRGVPVLSPYLSPSVAMKESHAKAMPVIHYRKKHKLSLEFRDLAASLLRGKKKSSVARSGINQSDAASTKEVR